MNDICQLNKSVVTRFNKAFIENGDMDAFREIVDPAFINHTAAPGIPPGPEGMVQVIMMLRNSFSDLHVTIHQQIAEGDLVATRKTIEAVHSGPFAGVPATGKKVIIPVQDMVQLLNGKYIGHWGRDLLVQCVMQQIA